MSDHPDEQDYQPEMANYRNWRWERRFAWWPLKITWLEHPGQRAGWIWLRHYERTDDHNVWYDNGWLRRYV